MQRTEIPFYFLLHYIIAHTLQFLGILPRPELIVTQGKKVDWPGIQLSVVS